MAKKANKIVQKNFFTLPNIVILLGAGFLLRIILSPFGTLTLDQNTFIAWSVKLAQVGFSRFYQTWSDYLPGYLYVLSILGQINKLNIIPATVLYKLPAIVSDIATSYLIYKIVFKLKNAYLPARREYWGRIAAFLYLFNPAIIANSTLWGQVDSLTALFSLLAVYLLGSNFYLSAICLAVGTLIKPQMAIVSLVILVLMIKRRWKVKNIFIYIFTSAVIFIAGFIPFSNGANIVEFVISRINSSLNQYPYTSINAFNFWQIIGNWKPDAILNIIGFLIVLVLFFFVGLKFVRQKGGEYILLAFTFAISFIFMTRMHERHLLPVFAPLTIAVAMNPIYIFALIGFSFVYVTNLFWAWNWVTNHFADVFGDFVIKVLSIADVLLLFIFLFPKKFIQLSKNSFLRGPALRLPSHSFFRKVEFSKPRISSQKIRVLFVGVVIFAAITRFYNLGSPETHYFDEVYHAFTAQNMLHGVTKAWEWWNFNPKGFAYEWTHPPVAKEFMALSMKLIGETSFGWRFPSALLGVGSVILIFFITKEIFKDELLALVSSAVLSLDGLPLVLSRIGMNDSYVLFFILACLYSYLKKRNLLSAIFFGLALASKWSALWVAPIIFVAHFVFKHKFDRTYIFFFIFPPLIYLGAYFPLFTNPQIQQEYVENTFYSTKTDRVGIIPLDMFIDTQKQMWWYHTRLKATHPYSSMWYTWPFLVRPVYLYTSNETDTVGRIYAMGNPIVFWGGIVAIAVASWLAIKEKNKVLGFVVFSYLVFFAPWAASPRIMFLYHYLPSIPFMAIVIAYLLRRYKDWRFPFLLLAIIMFVYFYPHWAGLRIPLQLDSSYYWFSSWR